MISKTKPEVRKLFLMKFTKELIHSLKFQIIQEEIDRQKQLKSKQEIEIAKFKRRYEKYLIEEEKPAEEKMITSHRMVTRPMPNKATPQIPMLPPKKSEKEIPQKKREPLKPRDTYLLANGEIDFGKLIPYIRDPTITSIECKGPDKNLIIKRGPKVITTNVRLNDNEIDVIIYGFSEKARIPLIEGLLRARTMNLMISAVVSKLISSRFVISKQGPGATVPRPAGMPQIPRRMQNQRQLPRPIFQTQQPTQRPPIPQRQQSPPPKQQVPLPKKQVVKKVKPVKKQENIFPGTTPVEKVEPLSIEKANLTLPKMIKPPLDEPQKKSVEKKPTKIKKIVKKETGKDEYTASIMSKSKK